jgi:hypothetical protein
MAGLDCTKHTFAYIGNHSAFPSGIRKIAPAAWIARTIGKWVIVARDSAQ